jgi:hypothetical protein
MPRSPEDSRPPIWRRGSGGRRLSS